MSLGTAVGAPIQPAPRIIPQPMPLPILTKSWFSTPTPAPYLAFAHRHHAPHRYRCTPGSRSVRPRISLMGYLCQLGMMGV